MTPGFVQNHFTTTFYRFPRCLGALCKEPRLTSAKCKECRAKTGARAKTVTAPGQGYHASRAKNTAELTHKKPLSNGTLGERAPQRGPHIRTLYSDVDERAPHVPIWSFFSPCISSGKITVRLFCFSADWLLIFRFYLFYYFLELPCTILSNDHAISLICARKEALILSFTSAVETRSQLSVLVYFELGFEYYPQREANNPCLSIVWG